MSRGETILGIDPGSRRIGIAIADLETRFAQPLEVIHANRDAVAKIAAIARDRGAVTIVVGKPIGLSGNEGPAVDAQKGFVDDLREAIDIPVEEFDERLTTVVAESAMRAAGATAAARKEMRDAVAAQVLLQGFLDTTR